MKDRMWKVAMISPLMLAMAYCGLWEAYARGAIAQHVYEDLLLTEYTVAIGVPDKH